MKKYFALLLTLIMLITSIPSVIYAGYLSPIKSNDLTSQVVYEGGQTSYPDDGLDISKTIVQKVKDGKLVEDEFEITLDVQSKEVISKQSNIDSINTVLVIDLSNSMEWDLEGRSVENPNFQPDKIRLDIAKKAVKDFVTEYADITLEHNGRLSIVLFNTDAAVSLDWGSIADDSFLSEVNNLINNLATNKNLINGREVIADLTNIRNPYTYADDGSEAYDIWMTNLEAGLTLADQQVQKIVDQDNINKTKSKNFVVSITDGKPTRKGGSVGVSQVNGLPTIFGLGPGSKGYMSNLPEEIKSIKSTSDKVKINSEFFCIFFATNKNNTIDKFTGSDSGGKYVDLGYAPEWFINNNIANETFDASDDNKLQWILETVENSIENVINFANAGMVVDPMGKYIDFLGLTNGQPVSTTDKNAEYYFDTKANTFFWNINAIGITDNSTGYDYSVSYNIKLNTSKEGFDRNNEYLTNGVTELKYAVQTKDEFGSVTSNTIKTANFDIPKVKALPFIDLKVYPLDMIDYIADGDHVISESNDHFPGVVLGKITLADDSIDMKDTLSADLIKYIIDQYAFYFINPDGSTNTNPTLGDESDPEVIGQYKITTKPGSNQVYGKYRFELLDAKLTTRPSQNQNSQQVVTDKLPEAPVAEATATVENDTVFVNSAGVELTDTSGVSLLRSDLLDDFPEKKEALMADIIFRTAGYDNISAFRLGLVDTNNGNIKLTTGTDQFVTVTLPYPQGTSKTSNHNFMILHYEEDHTDLTNPFDYTEPVVFSTDSVDRKYSIVKSDAGLQFRVDNFSPFAIAYKSADDTRLDTYYNLTYLAEEGGKIVGDTNQTVLENSDGSEVVAVSNSGYVFAGWSDGVTTLARQDKNITSDLNVTAKFLKTSIPPLDRDNHFAYMIGYPDKTFRPEANMTRAEATVMFSRLLLRSIDVDKTYTNSFTDVKNTEWYYNAIGYMEQFGIIKGYTDGTFKPDAPITRAEFAAISSRFDKLTTGNQNVYSDVPNNHWAKEYISFATTKGWVTGYPDGTFKPDNKITRSEVVTVTNRILERVCDENYVENNTSLIKHFKDLTNSHWAYYNICEAANGHEYIKYSGKETWTQLSQK